MPFAGVVRETVYYTAIDPWGREFDLECDTPEEAADFAQERFCEECEDNGVRGTDSAEIEIIGFVIDEWTGERRVVSRRPEWVEYEYYRGDYAEHNTYHRGGAI